MNALFSKTAVSTHGYSTHWQGSWRERWSAVFWAYPIFLTSILSLWIHAYPLWNYKMVWPRMEGSDLDTVWMNQPWKTTSPHPVPARPASCVVNTCGKSRHTQNSKKQTSCYWLLVRKMIFEEWDLKTWERFREVWVLHWNPGIFKKHHWNEVLVLKTRSTPHTTRPSEIRRKRPEIASQMSILLTLVHNWIQ